MKRLWITVVAIFVLAICIPCKSEAKNYSSYDITNLPQKTWKSLKESKGSSKGNDYYGVYNVFKIDVPSNGYIKIETNDDDSDIYVLSKLTKNSYPTDGANRYATFYGTKRCMLVAPKGKNYLYVNGQYKVRWSFVKAANTSNNCRAKARTLAKGKKETIVFNDGYEYSRWYKVTLKKRQPLTVNLKCLDGNDNSFQVYSSKGEEINCPPLIDYKTYRTTILSKGTYYIRIGAGNSWNSNPWGSSGRIKEFSWK